MSLQSPVYSALFLLSSSLLIWVRDYFKQVIMKSAAQHCVCFGFLPQWRTSRSGELENLHWLQVRICSSICVFTLRYTGDLSRFSFMLLSHRVRSLVLACSAASVSQQWPGCTCCRMLLPGFWQTLSQVPHCPVTGLFSSAPSGIQIWFQNPFHFTQSNMVGLWDYIYWVIESSQGLMDT